MKAIRAVICDVYRTLLDVREPPEGAEERWRTLCARALGSVPRPSLEELASRCGSIIGEDHREAHERGISCPEVNWPSVMKRALPLLGDLPSQEVETFIFEHAQLARSLRIMPDCAPFLAQCLQRGILLGIVSNAQAYTLRELRLALHESGLRPDIFQTDLTFWSFEHGFSKPDAHVFQILRARLQNRDVKASETLMVGDREDNDISPARIAGWKTWQFTEISDGSTRGDWKCLARALFESYSALD